MAPFFIGVRSGLRVAGYAVDVRIIKTRNSHSGPRTRNKVGSATVPTVDRYARCSGANGHRGPPYSGATEFTRYL